MSGKGEPYTCAICGGEFTKGRDDEEAIAEMQGLWKDTQDPGIVCDDCFQRVTAWAQDEAPETFREPPVHIPQRNPRWRR